MNNELRTALETWEQLDEASHKLKRRIWEAVEDSRAEDAHAMIDRAIVLQRELNDVNQEIKDMKRKGTTL